MSIASTTASEGTHSFPERGGENNRGSITSVFERRMSALSVGEKSPATPPTDSATAQDGRPEKKRLSFKQSKSSIDALKVREAEKVTEKKGMKQAQGPDKTTTGFTRRRSSTMSGFETSFLERSTSDATPKLVPGDKPLLSPRSPPTDRPPISPRSPPKHPPPPPPISLKEVVAAAPTAFPHPERSRTMPTGPDGEIGSEGNKFN